MGRHVVAIGREPMVNFCKRQVMAANFPSTCGRRRSQDPATSTSRFLTTVVLSQYYTVHSGVGHRCGNGVAAQGIRCSTSERADRNHRCSILSVFSDQSCSFLFSYSRELEHFSSECPGRLLGAWLLGAWHFAKRPCETAAFKQPSGRQIAP